jgi:hypothetical protein
MEKQWLDLYGLEQKFELREMTFKEKKIAFVKIV